MEKSIILKVKSKGEIKIQIKYNTLIELLEKMKELQIDYNIIGGEFTKNN